MQTLSVQLLFGSLIGDANCSLNSLLEKLFFFNERKTMQGNNNTDGKGLQNKAWQDALEREREGERERLRQTEKVETDQSFLFC